MIFTEMEKLRRKMLGAGNEPPGFLVSPEVFDLIRDQVMERSYLSKFTMENEFFLPSKILSTREALKRGIELPHLTYHGGPVHCSLSCDGVFALVGERSSLRRPLPSFDGRITMNGTPITFTEEAK